MEPNDNKRPGCLLFFLSLFGSPKKAIPAKETLPYERVQYLLTKAERSFFGVLESSLSESYLIFAKVRLADLIKVHSKTESRQTFFNRIQSKHIDFVICDREYIRPLVAVELDDSSHKKTNRQDRDEFVDDALNAAGLPLVRFQAKTAYNRQEVAETLNRVLPS